jgi:ceramide glucosyltransferase
MIFLHVTGWLLAALGLAGAAYSLLAAWLAARFSRRRQAAVETLPSVSVLKPLHGAEPALEANLETFFRQEYPAPFQLVFGVQTQSDPAIETVEKLCDRYPQVNAALVVSARSHGFNAKVSNLANMSAAAAHEGVVVASDSDIAVPPDYLRNLAGALAGSNVGAATCLYTAFAAEPGVGATFSAMGVNYHFLPNVITGVALKMANPCMGSTIALKSELLSAIGGFAAFADCLADDYRIGRAVREQGYRIVIPPFAVRHACGEKSVKEWLAHELRWMRTIRINDPGGHAGSIVTHPVPLSLLAAVLLGFSLGSLGVLGATLAARAVLKWRIDGCFGCRGGPLWLLPARDILSFGVFLASLFGNRIAWQGEDMLVAHDGRLWKS